MLKITSLQNPRIKLASKLINRRSREKYQKTLLEGYRLIRRALDANFPITECYFSPNLFLGKNEYELLEKLKEKGAIVIEVSDNVLKKIAYRDRPEGLIALSPTNNINNCITNIPFKQNGLYIVVESIEKPGNLGSILRSADAAGADGLIICDKCTDIYNPNVLRASTGALFYVPIAESDSETVLKWLQSYKIKPLAASPHSTTKYDEINYKESTALLIGTEQYGLSNFWLKNADIKINIPMNGKIDSLNVAISSSVLLFEAARQRRKE